MIYQSFKMAVKAIAGNKMRSFLTILGVVIGVVAIVVLVSIGQGANSSVVESIEGMGTNLITANINARRMNPIDLDSLNELAQNEAISYVAPIASVSGTVKAGTTTYDDGVVQGTTPGYESIRNWTVAEGRFLQQPDIDNRSFVAVIGSEAATEMYGTTHAVGETFSLNGYTITVVGVLAAVGSSASGSNDNQILIPFTLAQRLSNQTSISSFYVSAASSAQVEQAQAAVESYLEKAFENYNTRSFGTQYSVFNQTEMLSTLSETTNTLTLMLGGIAAISLLVGGIGIMNIMLVSVSERTREIGIRKAIGAARGNILTQFLIESLVVSLMGGLLGLAISVVAVKALAPVLQMTLTIPVNVAWMAIAIFGVHRRGVRHVSGQQGQQTPPHSRPCITKADVCFSRSAHAIGKRMRGFFARAFQAGWGKKSMRGFRTDLAMECIDEGGGRVEGVRVSTHHMGGITHTRIRIEKERAAELLGRHTGEYITLEYRDLPRCDAHTQKLLAALVAQGVRSLLPREGEVLVVGLGNRNVTADALGTRVVERMLVTRHLRQAIARELRGRLRGVSAIAPGVLGLTGIETAELCRGLVRHVRPSAVIAIDALAAFESERICTTVQITDTGIEPGSGVGNHRLGLTEETLGVKVIAVGVPMVVYASTIARDAMARLIDEYGLLARGHEEAAEQLLRQVSEGFLGDMVVTPREIDELVLHVAALLSDGINQALQPDIDPDTLHTYIQG